MTSGRRKPVRPPQSPAKLEPSGDGLHRHGVLIGLLLLAMTAAAYLPAAQAKFIWDDNSYPQRVGRSLGDVQGLARIWSSPSSLPQYYPLVFSTYWVENALWGQDPVGYHLVNVMLHGLSAILLWRLLTALRVPGAILAAALFAVHPMCVESVAWVTERKNTLSLVFYLLAMITYLPLAGLAEPTGRLATQPVKPPQNSLRYAAVLLLFIAALLSKTVTVTFPAAVLLLTWWKHGRIGRRDVLRMLPFFLLSIGAGVMTAMIEKYHVGAEGGEWTLNMLERILLAGQVVWFYVYKVVWPAELIFNYPHWDISWKVLWQYLPTAGLLAALVTLWLLRKRLGRGPLTAALLFIASLFPAMGFIDVYPFRYSYVADHFAYLGIPVILAVLAAGAAKLANHWPGRTRLPLYGAVAGVLILLGVLTWRQAGVYRDAEALWTHTLEHNPQSWMSMSNYGSLLSRQRRFDEALPLFTRYLCLRPDSAEAYAARGRVYQSQQRHAEALADFDRAVKLGESFEHKGFALLDRGNLYLLLGRKDEAIADYSTIIVANPRYAQAYKNRAAAYYQDNRFDLAWQDVHACERLGGTMDTAFMQSLQQASGRKE